ncbi:MAG: hypothetical protein PHD81_00930 [Candidatus Nanoarchaeia archaeon]|nr:hypothetical protein [Candidatus Nanoarchaeia archaeon]MDD5587654.1 hypothetical protein [Candidatus Nanoarchaeia archaeon]
MSFASKAIRKAAALTTGAVMMGATISGALAVTLKDFPSEFKDALVVVGTTAAGADDAAAADISVKIPASAKTTTISGDSYAIEQSGDKFNLGQTIYGLKTELNYKDLDLLAKQTWSDSEGTNSGDYDYKQVLSFFAVNNVTTGTGTAAWVYNQDPERDNKPVNDYLYFDNSQSRMAWNYTADIVGSKVKIKDENDIENTVLSILGRDYTIVDATTSNTSYGTLDKLTLLAGDVTATLVQGSTQAGVTIVDVDEAETKCVIEYQGKSYVVNKGEIKTMSDGTLIGISDVTAIHESGAGSDMCEVSIGAHKIVLENGKEVEVNNEKISGTLTALNDGTTGFERLSITYSPEDKTRLSTGESIEDPVFNAFKIVFDGVVENTEEIIIDPVGDEVHLTVTNKNDEKLDDMTVCWLNTTKSTPAGRAFLWGEDIDKPFVIKEGAVNVTNTSMGVEGLKQMRGIKFLASWNKESNIYEITNIDTAANETDIKVVETGDLYSDISYTEGVVTIISDINTNIQLSFDQNTAATNQWVNFSHLSDGYGMYYWTKNGANISFGQPTSMGSLSSLTTPYLTAQAAIDIDNCSIKIGEVDDAKESGVQLKTLNFTFMWDSTDDEIEFAKYSVDGSTESQVGSGAYVQKARDDSYVRTMRTQYGTKVDIMTKNDGEATINYPDEASYAKVVVAASEAVTGKIASVTPSLETEITDKAAQDLVLVGGPCANGLTASFTGEPTGAGCAANYRAGEALLKLYNNGANVALIVAGYDVQDTAMAAKALADGSKLPDAKTAKVTGESLEISEISVAAES